MPRAPKIGSENIRRKCCYEDDDKKLTVGELKERIKGFDDSMPIYVSCCNAYNIGDEQWEPRLINVDITKQGHGVLLVTTIR